MTLVDLIPGLRRTSLSRGGEYHGPCPWCGGTDRFIVWAQNDRYWCRQCQKKGDAIQLLRDYHGFSFKKACRRLGREPSLRLVPRGHSLDSRKYAREAARHAFERWRDQQAELLHKQRRAFDHERAIAELFYRLISRWPHLFLAGKYSHIVNQLRKIYDCLAVLHGEIELLVDDNALLECFRRWQAESGVQHG